MDVKVVSKKLIKPCMPTPKNLKMYKLSFMDELSTLMYVPFFFFYPLVPSDVSNSNRSYIEKLEKSLSKILPQFYPFAGRYIHNDSCIDCNDEGVEFVEAVASNVELLEFIKLATHEQLNVLVQKNTFDVMFEVTDPVISIQVTTFKCGGLSIGLSFTHRIVDADSMITFMSAWANSTRCASTETMMTITPTFDSPSLLPFKNLLGGLGDTELPLTRCPDVVAKRLLFDMKAITSLKAKTRVRASRVRLICAIVAKALIGVDRAKRGGKSRDCIINQAVNMRSRTNPPWPRYSCGNLVLQADTQILKDDVDKMGFEDLVILLGDAVDKTIAKCGLLLGQGEAGHNTFLDPIREEIKNMWNNNNFPDRSTIWISDCTKYGFYEVSDFGWGKPVQFYLGTLGEGLVVLMSEKDGDGIEVWVHMNKNDVTYLEEDEDIKLFCKTAAAN